MGGSLCIHVLLMPYIAYWKKLCFMLSKLVEFLLSCFSSTKAMMKVLNVIIVGDIFLFIFLYMVHIAANFIV